MTLVVVVVEPRDRARAPSCCRSRRAPSSSPSSFLRRRRTEFVRFRSNLMVVLAPPLTSLHLTARPVVPFTRTTSSISPGILNISAPIINDQQHEMATALLVPEETPLTILAPAATLTGCFGSDKTRSRLMGGCDPRHPQVSPRGQQVKKSTKW